MSKFRKWIKKEGIGRIECGRILEQMLARIRGEGDGANRTHLGDSET